MRKNKHDRFLVILQGPVFFLFFLYFSFFSIPVLFSSDNVEPFINLDTTLLLPYGEFHDYKFQEGVYFYSNHIRSGILFSSSSFYVDYRHVKMGIHGQWENEHLSDLSTEIGNRCYGVGFNTKVENIDVRAIGYLDILPEKKVKPSVDLGIDYSVGDTQFKFSWKSGLTPIQYTYTVPSQSYSDTKEFYSKISSIELGMKNRYVSLNNNFFWSKDFLSDKPWIYNLDLWGIKSSSRLALNKSTVKFMLGYASISGKVFHEVSPYVFLEKSSTLFVRAIVTHSISKRLIAIFETGGMFTEIGDGSYLDTVPFITGGGFYPVRFYAHNISTTISDLGIGLEYHHQKYPIYFSSLYLCVAAPLHSEYLQKVYDSYPLYFHYEKKEAIDFETYHHGMLLSVNYGESEGQFNVSIHQYVPVSNWVKSLRSEKDQIASPISDKEGFRRFQWGGFGFSCSLRY